VEWSAAKPRRHVIEDAQREHESCIGAIGVDGSPPAGCTRQVTTPVPVTIDFDLTVPPESATHQGDR
jgi:hypothetical protein